MVRSSFRTVRRAVVAFSIVASGVGVSGLSTMVAASDGTLDADFGNNGYYKESNVITENGDGYRFEATAMAVQTNGALVLAGRAYVDGESAELGVARLTAAGALDTAFAGNGFVRVEVPDNYDSSSDVAVDVVEILADGSILVAGRSGLSQSPYGFELTFAAKFGSDGALATSWGNQSTPNGFTIVTAPAIQWNDWAAYTSTSSEFVLMTAAGRNASDGLRTSAVSAFSTATGQPVALGSRSSTTSVALPDLRPAGLWRAARVHMLAGDQLLVIRTDGENPSALGVSKIDLSGSTDPSSSEVADVSLPSSIEVYGVTGVSKIVSVDDGVLVAAGDRDDDAAEPISILKFTSDGTFAGTGLNSAFGTNGVLATAALERVGGNGISLIVDDGKYVFEGRTASDFWVYRLSADGTLDTSFASDGKAEVSSSCIVDTSVGMSAVNSSGDYVFAGTNYNNELRVLVLGTGGDAATGCTATAPYTPPPPTPNLDPMPTLAVGQSNGALVACIEMGESVADFLVVSVSPVDFSPGPSTTMFPDTVRQFLLAEPAGGLDAFPRAQIWDGEDFAVVIDSETYSGMTDPDLTEQRDFVVGDEYRVRLFGAEHDGSYNSSDRVADGNAEPVTFTFGASDVDCGVEVPASSDSDTDSDSPSTSVPGSSSDSASQSSSLVTSSNAEQVAAGAGTAKLLVNGELVEVDVVQAPEELRRSVAGARSFAQVRALQALASDMVAAVQAVLGEGVTLPITVTNTDTGATISGLVSDPVSGDPLPVPVEDVLLIVNENLALMVGGADGAGDPANIAFDGVLEFGEGGYVAVLAYGLTPGAAGEVVVMSTPRLLDTFTVGSDGGVAAQAEIPSDLEAGEHTVVVAIEGQSASLGFRVLPEGVLPATGGESTPVPFAVLVLAAGGLAMLLVTRRRSMV